MNARIPILICLVLFGAGALQAQDLKAFKDTRGLYGYKDAKGNVVIQPQYHHAYDFTQGLGAIQYEAAHSYRHRAKVYEALGLTQQAIADMQRYNELGGK
ncbi:MULTISPECIES: WG repeat-containing protein [Parapedobacter]|uniref:WG repeat-containing protein n=1 Tax=Parapedobacter TaxID=416949 RepID=UPI00334088BC